MSSEGALRDGQPAGFELIETFRFDAAGFVRLDRHLARLLASATELGFACDPERVGQAIADAVAGASEPLRMRLALNRKGDVSASPQAYEPSPPGKVWKLAVAGTTLDSSDPLLRHKTTRRDAYVQARSEFAVHQADEVLLANERGDICEGTITNLFIDLGDGILLTPHIQCGLLPGVLRGELLENGRAREAILTAEDLKQAKSIFVGNSLRGLIPATL